MLEPFEKSTDCIRKEKKRKRDLVNVEYIFLDHNVR